MDGTRSAGVLAAALLLCGCQSSDLTVRPDAESIPASTVMPAAAVAEAPSGFIQFCLRDPQQCQQTKDGASVFALDPALWKTLWQVNLAWNAAIKPMDDAAHYGRVDYWTIPRDGYGDCEDYVLAKRKSLIDLGLPEQALRIAVARTKNGTAHTVLDVSTDHGDYILDNLDSAILPWTVVPYDWIARQVTSEGQWAFIGPARAGDQTVATADIMPQ